MSDYLAERLRAQSAAAAAERARRLNSRHILLESGLVAAALVLAVVGALVSYVIADHAASSGNPTVFANLARGGEGSFPKTEIVAHQGDFAEVDTSATGSLKPRVPTDANK